MSNTAGFYESYSGHSQDVIDASLRRARAITGENSERELIELPIVIVERPTTDMTQLELKF